MEQLTRISSDRSWEQMLDQNSQKSLAMLCERLGLLDQWKESMMEPAKFLENYLADKPELLIILLSEPDIDLLLLIWDTHKKIEADYSSRVRMKSLEFLGFIRYDHGAETVTVNEEAKHNFYFSLKSRMLLKRKTKYQEIEYAVKGILYVYGIVELSEMYDIISKEYSISYSEFWNFLIARMDLWSFLGILKNTKDSTFYAISYEVRERNKVFESRMRNNFIDYAELSAEDAIILGKMNGIGSWKGTQQLLAYGLDALYGEVMPATVFVKTLLVYVQNGDSLEEIREKTYTKMNDFSEEEQDYVWNCIEDMYRYTPMYHLKGHYRYELEQEQHSFSVIEGGRKE